MEIKNKQIFITGVSSGIGRALVKDLTCKGAIVFGIARRKNLLSTLANEIHDKKRFHYLAIDLTNKNCWQKILKAMQKINFHPNIIIFNAAILENDLDQKIDLLKTRKMFEINYFSIMESINNLLSTLKLNSQIIAISTIAALKGGNTEGIGYSSSKAALSLSFECLHQKYKNKYKFKTIYFGPVKSGMNPFSKHNFLTLSEKEAVDAIKNTIHSSKTLYYYPSSIFFVLKLCKILPESFYFKLLDLIDNLHKKNK